MKSVAMNPVIIIIILIAIIAFIQGLIDGSLVAYGILALIILIIVFWHRYKKEKKNDLQ